MSKTKICLKFSRFGDVDLYAFTHKILRLLLLGKAS